MANNNKLVLGIVFHCGLVSSEWVIPQITWGISKILVGEETASFLLAADFRGQEL